MNMLDDFWQMYLIFEEYIVIGYSFFEMLWTIFRSKKNTMFYLIMNIYINMIFIIDWQWIWFQNYFEDIKSRKSSSILMKTRKMLLFSKSFSVSISFTISIEKHPSYPNKEKTINFLFIVVIYFPLSIQINTI